MNDSIVVVVANIGKRGAGSQFGEPERISAAERIAGHVAQGALQAAGKLTY